MVHKSDGTTAYTDWFADDGHNRAIEETLKLVQSETGKYHVSWERREIEAEDGAGGEASLSSTGSS